MAPLGPSAAHAGKARRAAATAASTSAAPPAATWASSQPSQSIGLRTSKRVSRRHPAPVDVVIDGDADALDLGAGSRRRLPVSTLTGLHDISHGLTTFYATMPSLVGRLLLTGSADGLTGIYLPGERREPEPDWVLDPPRFADCIEQLDQYFAGDRTEFSLPLAAPGTPFQHEVWTELLNVDYGTKITYTELARRVGRPRSIRAVGGANGRNPICIVVPCHRVVGVDGSLTGYSAGIEAKRWLLEFEGGLRPAP